MPLTYIRAGDPADAFPPVEHALHEPNGLLAAGGDLSTERLLAAYQLGIFPWYGEGEPILWWSPNPRTVFYPERIHVSRRLARTIRQERFSITINQSFRQVIQACAAPRKGDYGEAANTWLLPEMQAAYIGLHETGQAYSVEVWDEECLAGGLYGILTGSVFSAESMFSRKTDASKVALAHLGQWCGSKGIVLIDAQVGSPHLYRMGAQDIPRSSFIRYLDIPASSGDD